MPDTQWTDLGSVDELKSRPLQQLTCGKTKIALIHIDGEFTAISGICNHVGGPLGEGTLAGGRLCRLPLALLDISPTDRPWRDRFRTGLRAGLCCQGRAQPCLHRSLICHETKETSARVTSLR